MTASRPLQAENHIVQPGRSDLPQRDVGCSRSLDGRAVLAGLFVEQRHASRSRRRIGRGRRASQHELLEVTLDRRRRRLGCRRRSTTLQVVRWRGAMSERRRGVRAPHGCVLASAVLILASIATASGPGAAAHPADRSDGGDVFAGSVDADEQALRLRLLQPSSSARPAVPGPGPSRPLAPSPARSTKPPAAPMAAAARTTPSARSPAPMSTPPGTTRPAATSTPASWPARTTGSTRRATPPTRAPTWPLSPGRRTTRCPWPSPSP